MHKLYNYQGNSLNIDDYVTPEMYGAKGDGTTDDSTAIQNAVNNKGLVLFSSGKNYKVTSTIRLGKDTVLDLNGSTITSTNKHLFFNFLSTDTFTGYAGNGNITIENGTIIGGAISFGHGENIVLENVIFKDSLNDHENQLSAHQNRMNKIVNFLVWLTFRRRYMNILMLIQ